MTNISATSNVCVVKGELSSPPQIRTFESGSVLAVLQIRTRDAGGTTTSVPVAVWEPDERVTALGAGDAVVVLGSVRRRFFRSGAGGPGSRVEVVAERVAPGADRRATAAVLKRAAQMVGEATTG